MKRIFLAFAILLAAMGAQAQSWSNILSPSRAISWTSAGLPTTLPDGEPTANPWTPPSRTQCGATIASGASPATINAALAACATGTYVLLGGSIASPATFTFPSTTLNMYAQNGVTLRGSGPMATTIILTGNAQVAFSSAAYGNAYCPTWATGFSQGATSITVSSCTGAPAVGQLLIMQQCDSGFSGPVTNPITVGTGCATGASYDNGALYVCGFIPACTRIGTNASAFTQTQVVYLTGVTNTGAGAYTLSFSPGLYMSNWGTTVNSQYSTPFVSWLAGAHTVTVYGEGLEDLTVYDQDELDQSGIDMSNCYGCWVKGVRFLGEGSSSQTPEFISEHHSKNNLISNNYSFNNISVTDPYEQNIEPGNESDDLVINNITEGSVMWLGDGSMQGYVVAYNYNHNTFTGDTNGFFEHGPAGIFGLAEGNTVDSDEDDDTNGTHDLNTRFREFIMGWQPPYATAPHPSGLLFSAYARFENAVANSIGYSSAPSGSDLTYYFNNGSGGYGYVYGMGYGGHTDSVVAPSSLRWANYDVVTGAVRYCGNSSSPGWGTTCSSTSEIPTTLTGTAAPFNNLVPSSTTLPCSFFLAGYTSTTCTAHPSGGTGLSWWKVCTAWTTFPTSCSTSSTPPFPAIGPDVSGGAYNGGTANDIPAVVAQKHLPIDTSLQQSFSITGSSWSSGTETLTVSGVASVRHLMGGFQVSGGACATSGAGTPTGAEPQMTASTITTVSYALASNPGACTGTMLFPDVKQFDERVYQSDVSGTLATPTFTPGSGTYTSTQSVTVNLPSGATGCYRTDGTNPAATVAGTCDAGSTTYSTAISVSSTTTILALATEVGQTNSSVASGLFTISLSPPNPPAPAIQLALKTTQKGILDVACKQVKSAWDCTCLMPNGGTCKIQSVSN